jgi:GR25 family glycosyltransferase involved in LPS biosynthesis
MFKKIYYINLEHRTDRKENMDKQLKKINFSGPIERVSAAYGKNLDLELIPSNLFTKEAIDATTNKDLINNTSTMTKGAMGCSLSQKWMYEKILCGNDDYVLILEDDITIPDNFIEKLKQKLDKMEKFDILYLGYHFKNNNKVGEHYDYPEKIWGTFGYIINKKAAKHLIEIFPLTYQIDSELPKIFKKLNVLALKENEKLITSPQSHESSEFPSDIQYNREAFTDLGGMDWVWCFIIMVFVLGLIYLGVRR